ncbi:MAG: DUF805 domain-containing protein, partial [Deltaproteobacteria bacterium]|nr:DUF805 domain-containing protein [Deltaproteobacteria bacterium]
MNSFSYSWRNVFNFNGRASRKEFWIFFLINLVIFLILSILIGFLAGLVIGLTGQTETDFEKLGILIDFLHLVIAICTLAILVRRIHDFGKSGWFILLTIIPLVG